MLAKYFLKSKTHGLLYYSELDLSEALEKAPGLAQFIEEPVYIVNVINGRVIFKIEYLGQ